MAELIDRKALKEALLERGIYPAIVKLVLEKAPTVDAVPVVRCKDCVSHNLCKFEQFQGLNGFCSYGERKSNATY